MTLNVTLFAGQVDDVTAEAEADKCGLSSGEPMDRREKPLGSVNGKPETDDKENNNGISTDETQAVRYNFRKIMKPTPKGLRALLTKLSYLLTVVFSEVQEEKGSGSLLITLTKFVLPFVKTKFKTRL